MAAKKTKRKTAAGALSIRDPKVRAAAVLLARSQYAMRAGITFRGQRDLYTALGYQRLLQPIDFRSRYKRGGIAGRVVDAYPKATWRGGAEVLEDDDPKHNTEFEDVFAAFAERMNLWSQFLKADILCGLGQFSILLIGAPGDFETPLPKPLNIDDIQYLTPYSQEDVQITEVVTDRKDKRFGLPLTYLIRRMAGQDAPASVSIGSQIVHWTRVIHIADNQLDDRVYGSPRLERVWNDIDNLEKITGGGSEAFWKRADQGMIFDMDPDLEWDSTEVAEVNRAADEMTHGYRRTMATRGMTMKQLGSDVARFGEQVDSIITLIAGATGIPKRILLGSERGELASTQDRENWSDQVSDRRNDFGATVAVRPFVDRLIEHQALPTPLQYFLRWPDLEELSEGEKATIALNLSNVNKNIGGVVVTPSEIRDRVLRWDRLAKKQLPNPDGWAPSVPYLQPAFGTEANWADQPWDNAAPPPPPSPFGGGGDQVPGQQDPPEDGKKDKKDPPKNASARVLEGRLRKHQVREEYLGSFRYQARRALRSARKAHNRAAVRMAALRGKADVVMAMEPVVAELGRGFRLMATVTGQAHHLTKLGARDAVRSFKARRAGGDVAISKESAEYAIDKILGLTGDLDKEARDRVAALAERALEKGWSPDSLASRLGRSIGLNDRQLTAVDNLRTRLEDAQPGDVVEFGNRSARVPSDGGSDEWVDRQLDRYSDDLVGDRAEMIADGLLRDAQSEAQREGWREAEADGELPPETERVWRASGDACPECADMDGETAPLDEPYDGPDGPVDGPQLHPWCNCDEELFEDNKRAASRGVWQRIASLLRRLA